jgi:hypothetical protein
MISRETWETFGNVLFFSGITYLAISLFPPFNPTLCSAFVATVLVIDELLRPIIVKIFKKHPHLPNFVKVFTQLVTSTHATSILITQLFFKIVFRGLYIPELKITICIIVLTPFIYYYSHLTFNQRRISNQFYGYTSIR